MDQSTGSDGIDVAPVLDGGSHQGPARARHCDDDDQQDDEHQDSSTNSQIIYKNKTRAYLLKPYYLMELSNNTINNITTSLILFSFVANRFHTKVSSEQHMYIFIYIFLNLW